jgi:uncharacterized membrane protein YccC
MHLGLAGTTGWISRHQAELRLALRVIVAGVATFALARLFGLPQGFWAVITSVIVMQSSVGGSLKAAVDRLIGTIAGALLGGLVSVAVPHAGAWSLAAALGLALAPLALLAALYPSFRIAPVTAVIVLLTPGAGSTSPVAFTIDRIVEISLGCIVGLAVALLVFPARAHRLVAEAVGRVLVSLAELLPVALSGLETPLDMPAVAALQSRIRSALSALEGAALEAAGERAGHLSDEPDPAPFVRTSTRLRHDLVMLIRAAGDPMPEAIYARLRPAIAVVVSAGMAFLNEAGVAVVRRQPPPPIEPFAVALGNYEAGIAVLRREGLTRNLSADAVGRLFAVGFALEQMHRDLRDLGQRMAEVARRA